MIALVLVVLFTSIASNHLGRAGTAVSYWVSAACAVVSVLSAISVEEWLTWALGLPQRLGAPGPVTMNALALVFFAGVCYLDSRRCCDGKLQVADFGRHCAQAALYVAPVLALLATVSSVVALLLGALVDEAVVLVTRRHAGEGFLRQWRLQGTVYLTLSVIYLQAKRRCTGRRLLP